MLPSSIAAVAGVLSVASFASNAKAGDWGWDVDCCGGYNSGGSVYYDAPIYSHASPTRTVYPHYAIQPTVTGQQTYVLPQDIYMGPIPDYTPGNGILVNQGQYYPDTTIPLGGYGGCSYRGGYYYRSGYGYRWQSGYGVR